MVFSQIGVYGGPTFLMQQGTLITDCPCEFTGGAGSGFAAGLVFERFTQFNFSWGIAAGMESVNLKAHFREREGIQQRSPATGREYNVPAEFRHTAELSIQNFNVTPYLKYSPFSVFFVRLGANARISATGNLTHKKELTQDSVLLPTGELARLRIPDAQDGRTITLQDSPYNGFASAQLNAHITLGLDFKLSRQIFLTPLFNYSLPLTDLSSSETAFSLHQSTFIMELRVII